MCRKQNASIYLLALVVWVLNRLHAKQNSWPWLSSTRKLFSSYKKKNVASLKATNIQVVNTDALSFLKQPGTPHHVVFIDPPFRKGLLDETVTLLEQNGWLAEDAMIYIETEKELSIAGLPENWHLHREKNRRPSQLPSVWTYLSLTPRFKRTLKWKHYLY